MNVRADAQSVAILRLEAQMQAARLMLGLLLANSPSALAEIKAFAPLAEEAALPFRLTDDQVATFARSLQEMVKLVEQYDGSNSRDVAAAA